MQNADDFTREAIADRLERVADRYHNAGYFGSEAEARNAAAQARKAVNDAEARIIEIRFNLSHKDFPGEVGIDDLDNDNCDDS